jgi:hypothetical protein
MAVVVGADGDKPIHDTITGGDGCLHASKRGHGHGPGGGYAERIDGEYRAEPSQRLPIGFYAWVYFERFGRDCEVSDPLANVVRERTCKLHGN